MWDDVTWSHSSVQKKANVPTLGPRFLVRVGKAIEIKCPTYAQGPPTSDLTLIDALVETNESCILSLTSEMHRGQILMAKKSILQMKLSTVDNDCSKHTYLTSVSLHSVNAC